LTERKDFRMNTALRTLLALLAIATALAASTAVAAPGAAADDVWVEGTVHGLLTGPGPANPTKIVLLYVIAPVARSHPLHPLADARTHGFGAHDHVIALTHSAKSFHGVCDLTLVVPGPKAAIGSNVEVRPTLTPAGQKPLLYAARLNGHLLPLNWASRIERAHQQGLATLVNTHVTLACTVTAAAG
jgi:hypothetical protein